MKFSVDRFPEAGVTVGGHILSEDFGFQVDFACAGVRLRLGSEECWLSRDEAHEMAGMIMDAATDA
jgi:hypothetical protein